MLQSSLLLKATKVASQPIALEFFCDWLEASLLFGANASLSLPEVVEFLVEEELCSSQEEAWNVINDAKRSMRARKRLLGLGYPILIMDTRLVRQKSWRQLSAYAFCLLLSIRRLYPEWFLQFGADFNEQGKLFEELTFIALERILAGWSIHSTGWSRSNPSNITEIVSKIAELLGEPSGDIGRWVKLSAKDAGLDILCFRPFKDLRGGIPIYLVQCASGLDWEGKLTSPDINVWCNLIQFSARPRRAFATPFVFVDDEFSMHAGRVQGLVLDRYRLLEPLRSSRRWISKDLSTRLNRWTKKRADNLPWSSLA